MRGIAVISLLAMTSAWGLLRQGDVKDNLNLRSAYLHVLGDALGSVGAIVAGALMYFFGWYIADPIVKCAGGAVDLAGSLGSRVPVGAYSYGGIAGWSGCAGNRCCSEIDRRRLQYVHVWTVTSGYDVFSGHIVVCKGTDISRVIETGSMLLENDFGIRYSTIQVLVEDAGCRKLSFRGGECPLNIVRSLIVRYRKAREKTLFNPIGLGLFEIGAIIMQQIHDVNAYLV